MIGTLEVNLKKPFHISNGYDINHCTQIMDLNAHAKSAIRSLTCPVHHKKPTLIISETQIYMHTCCTDFKISCLKHLIEVLQEYKANPLHVVWSAGNME